MSRNAWKHDCSNNPNALVAKNLNLDILHQHDTKTNPMDEKFKYKKK